MGTVNDVVSLLQGYKTPIECVLLANLHDGHDKFYLILYHSQQSEFLCLWGANSSLENGKFSGHKFYRWGKTNPPTMRYKKVNKGYENIADWTTATAKDAFLDAVSWAKNGIVPNTQASKSPGVPSEYSQADAPWWNGGPVGREAVAT